MIVERAFGRSSEFWDAVRELDTQYMHHGWNEAQWLGFDQRHDVLFVLLEAGQVIGFALYRLSPLEDLAHLFKVVLRPEFRGEGRAAAFCEQQLDWLRREQIRRVYLEVACQNEAATKLYTKLGFQKLRRVAKFYQDGQDAWTMEKPLESSI